MGFVRSQEILQKFLGFDGFVRFNVSYKVEVSVDPHAFIQNTVDSEGSTDRRVQDALGGFRML